MLFQIYLLRSSSIISAVSLQAGVSVSDFSSVISGFSGSSDESLKVGSSSVTASLKVIFSSDTVSSFCRFDSFSLSDESKA